MRGLPITHIESVDYVIQRRDEEGTNKTYRRVMCRSRTRPDIVAFPLERDLGVVVDRGVGHGDDAGGAAAGDAFLTDLHREATCVDSWECGHYEDQEG